MWHAKNLQAYFVISKSITSFNIAREFLFLEVDHRLLVRFDHTNLLRSSFLSISFCFLGVVFFYLLTNFTSLKFISELEFVAKALLENPLVDANRKSEKNVLKGTMYPWPSHANSDDSVDDDIFEVFIAISKKILTNLRYNCW